MTKPLSSALIAGSLLLLNACSHSSPSPQRPQIAKTAAEKTEEHNATKAFLPPPPPRKHIKPKEVQDDNYTPAYMYPEDTGKKDREEVEAETQVATQHPLLSREACIAMIGEAQFNRYSAMFGNETAALKRCTLLHSMRQK